MKRPAGRKRIIILGSTGSIGRNTLRVVQAFPERFTVAGLAAGRDWRTVARQTALFNPPCVAMADRGAAANLRRHLRGRRTRVLEGAEGVVALVTSVKADLVVSAIVGAAGLFPTWEAVRNGLDVALANKETLVMAGEIIMAEAARSGSAIIPVDSEHHAVAMALRGTAVGDVAAVTLTASGGPCLKIPASLLPRVTVSQALRHPRWRMGNKISIDSATMMNKGLEVIEACWLFGLPEDRIRVLVHPESIVHALVHLADGGVLAYLSPPDMRLPIAAALNHPEILGQGLRPLDLATLGRLTFMEPDHRRFPALELAREALRTGGTTPAVLNAANEVAVGAFLGGQIAFTDIVAVIGRTLEAIPGGPTRSLDDILAADIRARLKAQALLSGPASNKGRRAGGKRPAGKAV